ncbi:MAG TPA: hypothetical protein VGD17_18385, partial [Chitinophagaceae bacterium]
YPEKNPKPETGNPKPKTAHDKTPIIITSRLHLQLLPLTRLVHAVSARNAFGFVGFYNNNCGVGTIICDQWTGEHSVRGCFAKGSAHSHACSGLAGKN